MNSSHILGGAAMQAKNVKLFSSFALVIGLALLATPVFGQGVAFQASSLPQQARIEGLTETMGAVVLQATGTGTITSGSSITILYSGTITSTAGTNTVSGSFSGTTCGAAPAMPCPAGSGTGGSFSVTASGNQLTLSVTGGSIFFKAGDYIVISQVRVNVNALGSSASTVTATLSGTSANPTSNPITFTQSTVPVASVVSPSLSVSFNAGGAGSTLQTCSVTGPGGSGNPGFNIVVSERYPAALTTFNQETSFTPNATVHNGTQLVVTLSGVPAGLGVAFSGVNTNNTTFSGGNVSLTTGNTFQTGTPVYTFTVVGGSTAAAEKVELDFNVGAANSSSTGFSSGAAITALGTTQNITASVTLGPVQAASAGPVSFASNVEGTGTVATIGDCVTNLLFPFVTNQVGFDTSLQIANTSSDALAFSSGNATKQNGTCTLTLYPTDLTTQTATAAGTVGTPSQVTTPTIAAGGVYQALLSGTSFKSQSGYILAVCRFVDAHGFSFVTNGPSATATISQGLLALVIPNSSITASRLSSFTAISGGTTESLLH